MTHDDVGGREGGGETGEEVCACERDREREREREREGERERERERGREREGEREARAHPHTPAQSLFYTYIYITPHLAANTSTSQHTVHLHTNIHLHNTIHLHTRRTHTNLLRVLSVLCDQINAPTKPSTLNPQPYTLNPKPSQSLEGVA